MQNAVIFDIKGFAVHDGPGPRTTVFFKGCPMRCAWCHNPEGLSPEIQYTRKSLACCGCGKCRTECSHPECRGLGVCLYACPNSALERVGQQIDTDTLAARLKKDADFLTSSGGGVTFSGGEPTLYADFILELIPKLGGLHTAIETCGYCDSARFSALIDALDYIIMDIKLADSAEHKKWTGCDNFQILQNFKILKSSGKPHLIRTPMIPGITDTDENLAAIAEIIGDSEWEKIPYNTLAPAKYENLGMKYKLGNEETK